MLRAVGADQNHQSGQSGLSTSRVLAEKAAQAGSKEGEVTLAIFW